MKRSTKGVALRKEPRSVVLTDLSKAFDCISHDLLIARLDAYGFSRETAAYINSYLKNRKKGARINGTQSYPGHMISGVPQESILGPIFYDLCFNDFFHFISKYA